MAWKEKKWIIWEMGLLLFTIFFFMYGGWQFLYQNEILKSKIETNEYVWGIYSYKERTLDVNEYEKALEKWIDEENKLASFILRNENDIQIIIGVGKKAMNLFPKLNPELDKAYVLDNSLQMELSNEFYVSGANGKNNFQIEYPDKHEKNRIIGNGVYDMKRTVVLFLSYEKFHEIFEIYGEQDLLENMLFFSKEEQDIGYFADDFNELGINLNAYDWNDYVDTYFGNNAKSGLMYAAFFCMVGFFVLFSMYIKLKELIEKRKKEIAIEFLCGARVETMQRCIMGLLIVSVVLPMLFALLLFQKMNLLQQEEFQRIYIITIMIFIMFFVYSYIRIKNLLAEEKMGQYFLTVNELR